MLLTQDKLMLTTMDQTHENGLGKGSYLERLLEQQYQQIFQQFPSDRNGNHILNSNSNGNTNFTTNESIPLGIQPASLSYSGNISNKSRATTISNTMGIGINQQQQQQQKQMMNFLQERQQQHLMTGNIVGGSSDISSNLGISSLSANLGLDARAGSSMPSSAWVDGLSSGGHGIGAIPNAGGSFYSTEQDFLLNSQRFPSLGSSMGGNKPQTTGRGNGTFGDGSLTSILGGLPQFCLPTAQASFHAHQESSTKSFADILLAKQAQAALLQAARNHAPRTMRLPCGARGMKADHNSSTAYFDVPENARHGQHLLCSHSICRSAGVKFRYCFYCKKPVTKQNFRARHLHANLDPNNKNQNDKEVDRKKKKSQGKSEKKETVCRKETMVTSNGKAAMNRLDEDFKKAVGNYDEKDSVEALSDLHAGDSLERPSKMRKLSNSDAGGLLRR
mmetsp:Transcript_7235/g.17639  ORF Transcript_7235/g.17639 Transcript_7235/m.17639 type:complete len:447 (+) Transcript_7235:182-1522(+)